jgi:hypothetical protein
MKESGHAVKLEGGKEIKNHKKILNAVLVITWV